MWLFDTLVCPVVGYRAEIWGWREREEIESLQVRYIYKMDVRSRLEITGIYGKGRSTKR